MQVTSIPCQARRPVRGIDGFDPRLAGLFLVQVVTVVFLNGCSSGPINPCQSRPRNAPGVATKCTRERDSVAAGSRGEVHHMSVD